MLTSTEREISAATWLTDLIGRTPLWRVPGELVNGATVFAKLELFNPASSVKDRVGAYMIDGAERDGHLQPGYGTVIEATSGNTGIALAAVCAARGYRCIIVLPDNATVERISVLKGYGAEVVLTPHQDGYVAAIAKAEELHAATPGSWFACQHENPDNVRAHYETTGPEIWEATGGNVDVLVCGVGTGGTITGTARYLKERNPDLQVVAVEPERSPVLSEGWGGPHRIPGLNGGFVAPTTDVSLIDTVVTMADDDAYAMMRALMQTTGVFVGVSSGAAAHACAVIGSRAEFAGKTIVTVFPDSGQRYLSWMAEADAR